MDLRERLISWILEMRELDEDYARYALARYAAALPWMQLNRGVREAMNDHQTAIPCRRAVPEPKER